ncbi:MAG: tubulin-like doman-containing protein, partial [Armatimonadota bacterium]|nr:tubulin-like doman-containing protein [Armatimonadota bacterium]
MQLAVAPTVFVALGGTGQLVLHCLRRRLEERLGTADIPFFRWLYVDTHRETLENAVAGLRGRAAAWSATNQIEPSSDTLSRIQNPQLDNGEVFRKLEIDSWFDAHALSLLGKTNYTQGVGGRRMYSRLGFLASKQLGALVEILGQFYNELITAPRRARTSLAEIEPPYLTIKPTTVLSGVRFVVVSSSGGGTGSGSLIDFGFLLRKLTQERNWQDVFRIALVAMARDGVDTLNQIRNTAALLTELDHYDGTNRYRAPYLTLPPFECKDKPYDATFVVSATQRAVPLDADRDKAFQLLQWRMAEYLLVDSVCVFDDRAPGNEVVLPRSGSGGAQAFQADIGQNPPGLQTFGVSCREWPAAKVHRHLYGAVIRSAVDRWSSPVDDRVKKETAALREQLGLPDAATQEDERPRDLDRDKLCQQLLQKTEGFGPLEILQNLKSVGNRTRGRSIEISLRDVLDRVDRCFERRSDLPSQSSEPGTVYAAVEHNYRCLLDYSQETSLPQYTAERLLSIALDQNAGPATAVQVGRALCSALERERDFVEACLSDLRVSRPSGVLSLEACWRYANDRLLQLVLEKKKQTYSEMVPWVRKVCSRLENLVQYLKAWGSRPGLGVDLANKAASPACVCPPAEVQRLEEAARSSTPIDLSFLEQARSDASGRPAVGLMVELRSLVAQGLPEKDDAGNPTLLATGPPEWQGAVDFSYLAKMEQAIFEGVAKSPGNPYDVRVLQLVEQAANRDDQAFPSLMAEAELLTNFDVGAPEYAGLPFGGNPTHVTEIVQPNQAGYQAYQDAMAAGRSWLTPWEAVGRVKPIDAHTASPSLSAHVAACVVERCAIDTRFLVGYKYQQRRDLFERDRFPAVSDKRISIPPPPEALRR